MLSSRSTVQSITMVVLLVISAQNRSPRFVLTMEKTDRIENFIAIYRTPCKLCKPCKEAYYCTVIER